MNGPRTSIGDPDLLTRLREGDREAFIALVRRHNHSLFYLARSFVPSDAVAEEVVQDTWMAVVRGLSRFEGRSSIKTWLASIVVNRARSTGVRENRVPPMTKYEATVDASRFDEKGHWISPPEYFMEDIEDRVIADQLSKRLRSSLESLPERQRQVVTLRDIEGLDSKDVCELLEISEGNQRVLLHRGRSRLRQDLESEFGRSEDVPAAPGGRMPTSDRARDPIHRRLHVPRDRRRFDSHLSGCPHCTTYLAQMRATIRLTGRLRSEDCPTR